MSNPKRAKCPTCGKFLNNDVAALREQVNILTAERDQLSASLDKVKKQLDETITAWGNAKTSALHWEKAYKSKKAMCAELMEYDHWLATRNLWQRIFNVLERPEP